MVNELVTITHVVPLHLWSAGNWTRSAMTVLRTALFGNMCTRPHPLGSVIPLATGPQKKQKVNSSLSLAVNPPSRDEVGKRKWSLSLRELIVCLSGRLTNAGEKQVKRSHRLSVVSMLLLECVDPEDLLVLCICMCISHQG